MVPARPRAAVDGLWCWRHGDLMWRVVCREWDWIRQVWTAHTLSRHETATEAARELMNWHDTKTNRFAVNEETEMNVKHPEVIVELTGMDGNAFAVLGKVGKALKHAKLEKEEVEAFYAEATSGDYDHLLQTCMRWVTVE
jgi:hypothetical protein